MAVQERGSRGQILLRDRARHEVVALRVGLKQCLPDSRDSYARRLVGDRPDGVWVPAEPELGFFLRTANRDITTVMLAQG